MDRLSNVFLKGLLAVTPLLITVYVLYWFAAAAESWLGGMIRQFVSGGVYVPGMGIVLGFLFVMTVGFFVNIWVVRRALVLVEQFVMRIPVIKTLYSSIQDLIGFFSEPGQKGFNQVVMVDLGPVKGRVLGFVTRETFENLPSEMARERDVAVYIPMSYQLGGFTLVIDRDQLTRLEISLQEAMKFALTGGVRQRSRTTGRETGRLRPDPARDPN